VGQSIAVKVANGIPSAPVVLPELLRSALVACSSPTTCLVTGANVSRQGVVVPLVNGVPGAARIVPGVVFGSAACPTATTCVAIGVDSSGQTGVVTITDGVPGPLHLVGADVDLAQVACPSATTCLAVGTHNPTTSPSLDQGAMVAITGGQPAAVQLVAGTSILSGVACPTPATCQAVGSDVTVSPPKALIVSVTDTTSVATRAVPGQSFIEGISCATASTCIGVGSYDQDQGAVVAITDGIPGAPEPVSQSWQLGAVACPSAAPCEAVGMQPLNTTRLGITMAITSAALTVPFDHQTGVDTTTDFRWSTVPDAQGYILVVGSNTRGTDIVNSGILPPTRSSFPIPALPTGKLLHATILTKRGGGWTDFSEIAFTAAPGFATFTNPVNGQSDVDATSAFTWTAVPGSQGTILTIGTSPFGTDIFNSGILHGTQASSAVPALPGRKLYANLLTEVHGAFTRYQQISFEAAHAAHITYPGENQRIGTTNQTFTWTNAVAGTQNYILIVGRGVNTTDIVNSGILPATRSSLLVPSLPVDIPIFATILCCI
jgi:hypothetical protein